MTNKYVASFYFNKPSQVDHASNTVRSGYKLLLCWMARQIGCKDTVLLEGLLIRGVIFCCVAISLLLMSGVFNANEQLLPVQERVLGMQVKVIRG